MSNRGDWTWNGIWEILPHHINYRRRGQLLPRTFNERRQLVWLMLVMTLGNPHLRWKQEERKQHVWERELGEVCVKCRIYSTCKAPNCVYERDILSTRFLSSQCIFKVKQVEVMNRPKLTITSWKNRSARFTHQLARIQNEWGDDSLSELMYMSTRTPHSRWAWCLPTCQIGTTTLSGLHQRRGVEHYTE